MPLQTRTHRFVLALVAAAAGTASSSYAQCPAAPTIIRGSDQSSFNYFGSSLSMDTTPVGTMLVTGSTWRWTPTVGRTGAVSSHVKNGNTWTETALLRPADLVPLDNFGHDVAFDDPYLIVGASGVDLPASNSGAAYFFERSGTGWIPRGRLISLLAPAGSGMGSSVAITTANGGWAVAGAPARPNGSIVEAGGAYLFKREASGTWTHTGAIIDDNSGDGGHWQELGRSVAIAGDVLVVGAPLGDDDYDQASISGYIKVFRYQAGSWVQSGPARWSPPRCCGFYGSSVATDGNYIVVGAPRTSSTAAQTPMTGPDENSGCAYVYKWNTATLAWDLDGTLFAQTTEQTVDHANKVAISGGKVFLSNTFNDRVYQYRRIGAGNWVQEIAFTGQNATNATTIFADDFAVAGGSLAIADSYHSDPVQTAGAIFAFDIPTVSGNDACNGAKAVNAGTYTGCTTLATVDGASTCGQATYAPGPDIWYAYTPSCSQNVVIDTIGSDYDTVLSIHSDCPDLNNTNTIACNDDAGGAFGQDSMASVNVIAGTRYLIRVSGYNGASGSYTLRINEFPVTPSNNSCSTPVTVASNGTYTATTCAATTDGPATGACGPNMSKDVWYRFTPATGGTLSLDTCGSSFDTMLAVYPGATCPGGALGEIACNDDAGPNGPCANTLRSFLNVGVTAGIPYMIRVGGYGNSAGGDLTLHVNFTNPCSADFNQDGTVDFFDYLDFVDAFSASQPAADFNGDTVIDFFDYLDFVDAFSTGC